MIVINVLWFVVNLGLLWATLASCKGAREGQQSYLGIVFLLLVINSTVLLGNMFG